MDELIDIPINPVMILASVEFSLTEAPASPDPSIQYPLNELVGS